MQSLNKVGSARTFCIGGASSPADVRRLSGLGDQPTRFMDLAGNKASFGVEMSTPFRSGHSTCHPELSLKASATHMCLASPLL